MIVPLNDYLQPYFCLLSDKSLDDEAPLRISEDAYDTEEFDPNDTKFIENFVLNHVLDPVAKTLDEEEKTAYIDKEYFQKTLDDARWSPLALACHLNKISCVEALIAHEADVDMEGGEDPKTPLYWACLGGHTKCTDILVRASAKLDKLSSTDETALYIACRRGHDGCVKILLDANAYTCQETTSGMTALLAACFCGSFPCVNMLLQKTSIDPDQADMNGQTALMYCCRKDPLSRDDCPHDVKKCWCAEAVLSQQSINNIDINRQTALMKACADSLLRCVRLLLENKAEIRLMNSAGQTALDIAVDKVNENNPKRRDDKKRILIEVFLKSDNSTQNELLQDLPEDSPARQIVEAAQ